MVMVFRRAGSSCTASTYVLEGLRSDATYTVTDIDTKETVEISGRELITKGLEVTVPNRYQSKILVYKNK